ncbi:MAG TPA: aquaporin [Candidatus Saccharimonadales bacterium]
MFGKRKVAALVAEFLGTGILTLLVLSVQRSTIGVPFFVALIAGLTMTVMYFALSGASGGYFNPAIAIGFWTARRLSTLTAILFVAFELLGGWAAYYLYGYFVHSKLTAIGGHYNGRTLAAEAVGAGILAFVWAAVSYQKWTKPLAGSALGIATMVGMISAAAAGIGIINPALALGVNAWVWGTYVLGPVLGAVVGINLYGLLFATKEEVAAGGADTLFAMPSMTSTSYTSQTVKPSDSAAKAKKPAAKKKSSAKKSSRK